MNLEYIKSERFKRLLQRDDIDLQQQPPTDFIRSTLECVENWDSDRKRRHEPNGLIYHYCDAAALMNILNYRKLWATSTKYLNDSTELLSLTSNFESHADRHRRYEAEEVLSDIIDFYRVSTPTYQTQVIGMDRFACCFSADGDLLSQWRAYGNNGRGYAIGFDPNMISGLVGSDVIMELRKITYGGREEARLVDDLFERFEPIVASNLHVLDNTGWRKQSARNWLSMKFGECLFNLVEEIKHPAFAEENEWRLYASGKSDIGFRISQDRVVPYVELDLSSTAEPLKLPIAEIVVGPRLDFREAVASLTIFTSSIGYGTSMEFRKSLAPYR